MKLFCSVIVPVYNAEKYLEKCIESILNQNFDNYELILVNDGSSDKSGAICEKYAIDNNHVKYIAQENQGHTIARNNGLSIAEGEYVIFVDSDDWIEHNLLSDCYKKVIEYGNLDIILYGYKRVGDNFETEKPQPYNEGVYDLENIKDKILPSILTSGRFSLSERMTKKEIIMKYQDYVDPKIKLGEDMLCCTLALSNAQKIYVSKEMYYNYFQHTGSVIHSYSNYTFDDWRMIKKSLIENLLNKIPNFYPQLGFCSIRFLDRAVIGEFERNGLSLKTIFNLKSILNEFPEIKDAKNVHKKRNIKIKYFFLRYKLVFLYYLIFKLNNKVN